MKIKINKSNTDLQEKLAIRIDGSRWHGEYFTAICPFHTSFPIRASLFVNDHMFWCASCSKSGSLEYLEHKLSNTKARFISEDVEEVIDERPNWGDYLSKYGSYVNTAIEGYKVARNFPVLVDCLKKRGLDIVTKGKIGYVDGWLSFPVFDCNDVFVDWVLRATPNKQTTIKYATRPRKNKSEGHHLYAASWERVETSSEIFIPFGVLDMWTLHECGFTSLTGLLGKSYQPSWFENIRKKIYLIPDRGEEKDAYKFASKLGWRGKVLMLDYPDDCKDPNDILRIYGKDAVITIINSSLRKG